MHMAKLLNQHLAARAALRLIWRCDPCGVIVNPRLDTGGPHCPYCHQDLKSPMERVPPTAPLDKEPVR